MTTTELEERIPKSGKEQLTKKFDGDRKVILSASGRKWLRNEIGNSSKITKLDTSNDHTVTLASDIF